MFSVYSKFDFGLPRSAGSFDVTVSLAGNSLASDTASGSAAWLPCPSAFTVRVCSLRSALAGTSRRSWSETLASGAGIAAATGCPPPSSVAVQPLGTPSTESWYRCGCKSVILQAQRDVRRGAGPHRDRRIVGHQIKALDVARRLRGVRRANQCNGESKGDEIEALASQYS